MKPKSLTHYVIATYATFWLMVLGLCGTASMVFHAPPLAMRVLADLCAWSPTIVLLCLWRRLRSDETRRAFIARCFGGRVAWYVLPLLAAIVAGGVLGALWLVSLVEKRGFATYFSLGGWSLPASVLLSLFFGSTGEELGWRGYVREELSKRHPFVKAALLQGAIWTFWHTVLWFVDSDFAGWLLLPYMLSNLLVMTSLALMMNVVLENRRNLACSMLMHFAFNFPYCFLQAGIAFYGVLSLVFVLLAAGFLLWRERHKPAVLLSQPRDV